jgi:hypothetical protein
MKWIWLLGVGVVMALALALVALWRPLPLKEVVHDETWCCAQCSDAAPLKCTGCETKEGDCPVNRPTTLDCPGRSNQTLITGAGQVWTSRHLLLKQRHSLLGARSAGALAFALLKNSGELVGAALNHSRAPVCRNAICYISGMNSLHATIEEFADVSRMSSAIALDVA